MTTYRVREIDVPADAPFTNDMLGRRATIEFLFKLVAGLEGPFVLAVDGPWGTGKTASLRMLRALLEANGNLCLYINAWAIDYASDPLVAVVASIDQVSLRPGKPQASFEKNMAVVRKVATAVAKRGVVAAAKVVTAGVLDLEQETEKVAAELGGQLTDDAVKAFVNEGDAVAKFRTSLSNAVKDVTDSGKRSPVVVLIDELDRCKPLFAVAFIERIKHLFDLEGVVFVLGLDKRQLENCIKAVYGQGIDAAEYLRKFIDIDYRLPRVRLKRFIQQVGSAIGLDDAFAVRTHPDLRYDKGNLIDGIVTLAERFDLPLRAVEKILVRTKIVLDQTAANQYLYPHLVALLVVLRSTNPEMFRDLVRGDVSHEDVIAYLNGPTNREVNRSLWVIQAYLLVSERDERMRGETLERLKQTAANERAPDRERERAGEVLAIVEHIKRESWRGGDVRLEVVLNKVDLAGEIAN